MRSVVFKTPGKIDYQAFTMFGVTSKPNSSNPIGYFGTGLKYAVAVCLREKCKFTLYSGGEKYEFQDQQVKFRDKDIFSILMTRTNKFLTKRVPLPFTLELGKTWKLWQAFRELYANTLDEGGEAYTYNLDVVDGDRYPEETHGEKAFLDDREHTYILVESDLFVEEFLNREKTFLPDSERIQTREAVQWFDRPSKHIYWRGMRIMDLPENEHSVVTWNVLSPIELTEDRTAKNQFYLSYAVARFIVNHPDSAFIRKIISAPEKTYESKLNFDYETPSKEFLDTFSDYKSPDMPETQTVRTAANIFKIHRPEPALEPAPFALATLVDAIQDRDWVLVLDQIRQDPDQVINWLKIGESAEASVDNTGDHVGGLSVIDTKPKKVMDDEIPF